MQALWFEFQHSYSFVVVGTYFLTLFLIQIFGEKGRIKTGRITLLVLTHLALVPTAYLLKLNNTEIYQEMMILTMTLGAVAIIAMISKLLFEVFLIRLKTEIPRILQDVLMALASLTVFIIVASKAGYNLSGLIATSAVLTGVIGFAMQDTLGNIIGGLVLQMDNSIQVGDWIEIEGKAGRVSEIRWRYTAIETRNWETFIIPNSAIMKGHVLVLGRRIDQPVQWRRWVYFNVDFRYSPIEVIKTVNAALKTAALEVALIAPEPSLNCILMGFEDSYCRYAVRYWLTDLAVDDPTDSQVRSWIFYALKRAGIPLSMPAHSLFITEESEERKQQKTQEEIENRIQVLSRIELFQSLTADELEQLATRLRYAPFIKGEVMTHQGAEGHWLYIISEGKVSIRLSYQGGPEKEIAQLKTGDFFGEMSLLTGEERTSTAIALTDVECYRLDKTSFKDIIEHRPNIADFVAEILAKRKVELEQALHIMAKESGNHQMQKHKKDILYRIRQFFGLLPGKNS